MVNDKLPIKQTNQQKMLLFGLHSCVRRVTCQINTMKCL